MGHTLWWKTQSLNIFFTRLTNSKSVSPICWNWRLISNLIFLLYLKPWTSFNVLNYSSKSDTFFFYIFLLSSNVRKKKGRFMVFRVLFKNWSWYALLYNHELPNLTHMTSTIFEWYDSEYEIFYEGNLISACVILLRL